MKKTNVFIILLLFLWACQPQSQPVANEGAAITGNQVVEFDEPDLDLNINENVVIVPGVDQTLVLNDNNVDRTYNIIHSKIYLMENGESRDLTISLERMYEGGGEKFGSLLNGGAIVEEAIWKPSEDLQDGVEYVMVAQIEKESGEIVEKNYPFTVTFEPPLEGAPAGSGSGGAACSCQKAMYKHTTAQTADGNLQLPPKMTCPKKDGNQKALGPGFETFVLGGAGKYKLNYCFEFCGVLVGDGQEPAVPGQCGESQEIKVTLKVERHDGTSETFCTATLYIPGRPPTSIPAFSMNTNLQQFLSRYPPGTTVITNCNDATSVYGPDDYNAPKSITNGAQTSIVKEHLQNVIHWVDAPGIIEGQLPNIKKIVFNAVLKDKITASSPQGTSCECSADIFMVVVFDQNGVVQPGYPQHSFTPSAGCGPSPPLC